MRTAGVISVAIVAALFAAGQARLDAQPAVGPSLRIGASDLGGVVTGAHGPEAGVWVIAETTDLPTKYAKIVATDDRGRYVMPDLPRAGYTVWVRGDGLVDSPKVRTAPGKAVNLTAVLAPSPAAAAQYYPAIYWYSMLKIPQKSEFPLGKAAHQGEWLNAVKSGGCNACHAMGTPGTRTMPKDFDHFKSSAEAWGRRIQSGQALTQMVRDITRHDAQRALSLFGDWTDRIAAGELPFATPERPRGIERNVVLTLWDWSRPTAYLHDFIGTDRRNRTINPNGKFYGSPENSTDYVPILDPITHTVTEVLHPVRDPTTPSHRTDPMAASRTGERDRSWT